MSKKASIILLVFQLLFTLFATAYCLYHGVIYPSKSMVSADNLIFFQICYFGSAVCFLASAVLALVSFLTHNFHRSFGFSLGLILLPALLAYILTALYQGAQYGWDTGMGGLSITNAVILGAVPMLLMSLGLGFGEKYPLVRAVLFSVAILFLTVAVSVLFYRVFLYDYGEPYSGKGGLLHFVFAIPALLLSYGVILPALPFLWIETVRALKKTN
jgi:hypothetical protein